MKQVSHAPGKSSASVKCDLALEVLRSFGKLRFAATGSSMLPAIWPGETLVVERARSNQFQVGDVVLVERRGGLCAHRLVSKVDGLGISQWITQGDAISVQDDPVDDRDVLGRVAYVIRAGRLVPVPPKLSVVERVTANIAGRSASAARALVLIHGVLHARKKLVSQEVPCQS